MNNSLQNDLQPRISIRGLSKRFEDKIILDNLDLDIMPGKSMTVIGMSGIGKSVLIKCILGLMKPDSGEVLVDGENWLALNQEEQLDRMKRVGMLFQGAALFDSLSVWKNVSFALLERGENKATARNRASEVLEWVGLPNVEDLMPSELSGGMKKRVGLARTICHKPDIVFLDEPTTGLDPITGDAINDLIIKLQRELGVTSVAVTHDMPSAFKIADRMAMLSRGKIVFSGSVDEVRTTDHPMVRQFIEGNSQGPLGAF
jgi:phospholipid/cholesterol/gamma-HCH transport system ATP-binding protein